MPTQSLEDAIALVTRERRQRWGLGMPPPCTDDERRDLWVRVHERLGVCPPNRYFDLLRITNGLAENGLEVFASRPLTFNDGDSDVYIDGLVERNEQLRADREGYDRLVVYAWEGMYVHAMDLESGKYIMLAHDDEWPSRLFDTFEEMLVHAVGRIVRTPGGNLEEGR